LALQSFGPIHFGRKRTQLPRCELRKFCRDVEPVLAHPVIWFDQSLRALIADAIGEVIRARGYTCYACAILKNHVHLVMRTHRDDSIAMLVAIADATDAALHAANSVPADHPVWSDRPFKVFLKTREDVFGRIRYVQDNPVKEGLPLQTYPFVVPCKL
jgi:REP element-mobilizing transposase RayT